MLTYYSHLVFLPLATVPSTYQASNNEIPSVFKLGLFQPISGPLPITQQRDLEESMSWFPGGHTSERDVSNKRDD